MPPQDYALGHADAEIRRQRIQAQLMRPLTDRMLDAMGVTEGQTILDIGCGPGDVTLLAAERVGTRGRVIGIDFAAEAIDLARHRAEAAGFANVTFHVGSEGDLDALPDFDAVVGRLVLIHQKHPVKFLRSLAAKVRPGGNLGFHGHAGLTPPRSRPALAIYDQVLATITNCFQSAFYQPYAALEMADLFQQAGLPEPSMGSGFPVITNIDSLIFEWCSLCVASFVKLGVLKHSSYDVETLGDTLRSELSNARAQWEDFARDNATRLLSRYCDRLCTFNDDIQGTAAVAVGTLLAAFAVAGTPLTGQRVVIFGAGSAGCGAGSAGCGIAGLLSDCMTQAGLGPKEARAAIHMVDVTGLVVEGMPGLLPFQERFAQAPSDVAVWQLDNPGRIGLADVIRNVRPAALIGVSGQGGAFTEEMIRAMAARTARPIILPLSNPTQHSEATPSDLLAWTDGRALVGTGSPFPDVTWNGKRTRTAQTNNVYIFPGMGLGVLATRARRVTDGMFMAAARALADMSPALLDPNAPLLPPISALRDVAVEVALAVARQAQREDVAGVDGAISETILRARMWRPEYQPYVRDGDTS